MTYSIGLTEPLRAIVLGLVVAPLFAGCAADPVGQSPALACEESASVRTIMARRSDLIDALLIEAEDHRYENCDDGSECHAHVAALAAQLNASDEFIAGECEEWSKWRQGIDGLIDPRNEPLGTLAQYEGDVRRETLHRELVANALADAEPDDASPEVILTMGAPGSGKSYVLRHLGLCQDDVVLVDPDEFKKSLVEYQVAVAADDVLAADRVHRESSMLAKRARDEGITSRRDLCIDGVLSKADAALELIGRLRDAGYAITIVSVSLPFDIAYERVLRRGEETGRFVPRDYAKQAHDRIEQNRDEILRAADRGLVYDTNQPQGQPPRLIATYQNGEKIDE